MVLSQVVEHLRGEDYLEVLQSRGVPWTGLQGPLFFPFLFSFPGFPELSCFLLPVPPPSMLCRLATASKAEGLHDPLKPLNL